MHAVQFESVNEDVINTIYKKHVFFIIILQFYFTKLNTYYKLHKLIYILNIV